MFEKDEHVISHALNMWANYIETGDVSMSTGDAIRCNERKKIKELSTHQVNFVMRLRTMSNNIFNGGFNDRNNS